MLRFFFQKADPETDPKFNRVKQKVLGQTKEDTYMDWNNLAGFILEKPHRAVLWFSNDIKNYVVNGKFKHYCRGKLIHRLFVFPEKYLSDDFQSLMPPKFVCI